MLSLPTWRHKKTRLLFRVQPIFSDFLNVFQPWNNDVAFCFLHRMEIWDVFSSRDSPAWRSAQRASRISKVKHSRDSNISKPLETGNAMEMLWKSPWSCWLRCGTFKMAIRDEDVGWKPRSQNAESREALAPKVEEIHAETKETNGFLKWTYGMMTLILILWRNWRFKDYDFEGNNAG